MWNEVTDQLDELQQKVINAYSSVGPLGLMDVQIEQFVNTLRGIAHDAEQIAMLIEQKATPND